MEMFGMFPQSSHDSVGTLKLYEQLSILYEQDRLSLRHQAETLSEIRENLGEIARQIRNCDRGPSVS
jgi:hypothetical protein